MLIANNWEPIKWNDYALYCQCKLKLIKVLDSADTSFQRYERNLWYLKILRRGVWKIWCSLYTASPWGKLFQVSSTELPTAQASPNIKFREFLKDVRIPHMNLLLFKAVNLYSFFTFQHLQFIKKKASAITLSDFYLTLKVYRMTWQVCVCCCSFITPSIACISYFGSAAVVAVVLIFSGNFEMGRLNNFPTLSIGMK